MHHDADCQLQTVPTVGLCTCDFDKRMAATIDEARQKARLFQAAFYTPAMILDLQDALITNMQNSAVLGNMDYTKAQMYARQQFEAWESQAFEKHGTR